MIRKNNILDVYGMKFEAWNIGSYAQAEVELLQNVGYSPLTARVLCSRGCHTPLQAKNYLVGAQELYDPLQMKQMDAAAARLRLAIERHEHVAVYGDYDVDGITATCLLTDFLRKAGLTCTPYIPGRVGEGYGLNRMAIEYLHGLHVDLIVTVDCGITAVEEAQLCGRLGMDLIITDHHECKQQLPQATAVVDPCRPDRTYPHADLCGVGVAFKLAAAVSGDQERLLRRYADLVCLGTIADVMPLQGENRTFVIRGLERMQHPDRVGLAALIRECGCDAQPITANTVGYVLAPRINAAGRMGKVELATTLFLTDDAAQAMQAAQALCALNRERQQVEMEIYRQALGMLPHSATPPQAVVLADERWHQGVVGIVASRLAEECGCPTFLICLDGDHGKASSRSYGGFNLFASLSELSDLLENYGGHELAAGFTIARDKIDRFRQEITRRAASFVDSGKARHALDCDCTVTADLLTLENVAGLDQLEPCGSGCPHAVLCMENLLVEQLTEVGGGKHLRLRLRAPNGTGINGIFFSTNILRAAIAIGDRIDVAFTPQINEFRGSRTVQLNVTDVRPSGAVRNEMARAHEIYRKHHAKSRLSREEAAQMLPARQEFALVWRYLVSQNQRGSLSEELCCLSRKIARYSNQRIGILKTRVCLDVFAEQGLISLEERRSCLTIIVHNPREKVDLTQSSILRDLVKQKAGDFDGNLSGAL